MKTIFTIWYFIIFTVFLLSFSLIYFANCTNNSRSCLLEVGPLSWWCRKSSSRECRRREGRSRVTGGCRRSASGRSRELMRLWLWSFQVVPRACRRCSLGWKNLCFEYFVLMMCLSILCLEPPQVEDRDPGHRFRHFEASPDQEPSHQCLLLEYLDTPYWAATSTPWQWYQWSNPPPKTQTSWLLGMSHCRRSLTWCYFIYFTQSTTNWSNIWEIPIKTAGQNTPFYTNCRVESSSLWQDSWNWGWSTASNSWGRILSAMLLIYKCSCSVISTLKKIIIINVEYYNSEIKLITSNGRINFKKQFMWIRQENESNGKPRELELHIKVKR